MVFLRCVSTFAVYILLYHSVSVKNTMIRVMQFSGPAPVSLFPPPETGEGEGGGEDQWRTQAVLLPPIPTFPRQGGRGRRPREARKKSRTEWPCTAGGGPCAGSAARHSFVRSSVPAPGAETPWPSAPPGSALSRPWYR